MGVTSATYADIKPILEKIKNDGKYTDERIKSIVSNSDITSGIAVYNKMKSDYLNHAATSVLGLGIFVCGIPFRKSSIIGQAALWVGFALVFKAAYSFASCNSEIAGKVENVRSNLPSAYEAIQSGLIPLGFWPVPEFTALPEKHAYDSPIEWCVGELNSTTDAALYAVVYDQCGVKKDQHLSNACAYISNKEQLTHLINLGAKITTSNLSKILLKAVAAGKGEALHSIAIHYSTHAGTDEKFISKSIIRALFRMKQYDIEAAGKLAYCLFSGCNPDYRSLKDLPIEEINDDDFPSLELLVEESLKGKELLV